jgi:hypothetical protein
VGEAALSWAPETAPVTAPGDGAPVGEAALSWALWPKWYVRSELHESFRRNLVEEPLAGAAAVTEKSWRGVQVSAS